MWGTNPYRNQPREQPWGWAFFGSLMAHLGAVVVLGVLLNAPLPPVSLPGPIKVTLISMPAAPKAQKVITTPPAPPNPAQAQPMAKKLVRPKPAPVKQPEPVVLNESKPEPVQSQPKPAEMVPKKTVSTEAADQSEEIDQITPIAKPLPDTLSNDEAATSSSAASTSNNAITNYSNLIRARIDKVKRYPLMAQKAGKQGTVTVGFSVDSSGKLLNSEVVGSCGVSSLDKAALKALRRASPFAPLPEGLASPHAFSLQINFSLAG